MSAEKKLHAVPRGEGIAKSRYCGYYIWGGETCQGGETLKFEQSVVVYLRV